MVSRKKVNRHLQALILIAPPLFAALDTARADFDGPAIKVDAKQNAAGVVLSCVTRDALIRGYAAANRGDVAAARNAGCVTIPDGAAVAVDCSRTNRVFARIRYQGRIGWTSYELLTADCRQ